jgi:hypothetical protein
MPGDFDEKKVRFANISRVSLSSWSIGGLIKIH